MQLISTAIALVPALSALAQVSQPQLDQIAQDIVTKNQLGLSGEIIVDAVASQGAAAIRWQGTVARISCHPQMMANTSANSWAFVLGHELSHQVLQHQGSLSAAHEFAADERGARLAMKAGYNLRLYIQDMYTKPNNCTQSHGCFHSRARKLKKKFRIDTGKWNDRHLTHDAGKGAFPPVNLKGPIKVPCRHKVACQHQIRCGHFFPTPFGPRPEHPFDTLHPFDFAHPYDIVQ